MWALALAPPDFARQRAELDALFATYAKAARDGW
jgi:hypothetical protein